MKPRKNLRGASTGNPGKEHRPLIRMPCGCRESKHLLVVEDVQLPLLASREARITHVDPETEHGIDLRRFVVYSIAEHARERGQDVPDHLRPETLLDQII